MIQSPESSINEIATFIRQVEISTHYMRGPQIHGTCLRTSSQLTGKHVFIKLKQFKLTQSSNKPQVSYTKNESRQTEDTI